MSASGIGLAVLAGVITYGAVQAWVRLRRRADQALASRANDSLSQSPRPRLDPESKYLVRVTDTDVECTAPDGTVSRISWADLQEVGILTTSGGPFAPDVFWMLLDTAGGCAIPQGTTGDDLLLDRLWKLPGFDGEAFINAMSCATDNKFICWRRGGAAPAGNPADKLPQSPAA